MAERVNILIPTLNEAVHIRDTVANARQLGEVFVLDSGSTDGTGELAREAGANVFHHPFEDYAKQKNWAIDNLPWTSDWVFILDADERISPTLRDEVMRVTANETTVCGFLVNRIPIFMGRTIRHGGLYPSWNLRLFRRHLARYEDRGVHEHMICKGPIRYLRGEMVHIHRESITEYLAKHIRYADMESEEWIRSRARPSRVSMRKSFGSFLAFRQWVRRNVWPRLPFRPFVRFLYMYIVRFGFLDGRAGWHLAQLMASYEYMISLLYKEKLQRLNRKDC